MKKINCIIIFCLVIGGGCSHVFPARPINKRKNVSPVAEGKVFRRDRLAQGGKFVVIPFSPGVHVEATEEVERVSLMVVKGVAETLAEAESPLEILWAEDADAADMIMKGYVAEMRTSRVLKNFMLKKEKKGIKVDGELIDREDGSTILKFYHYRKTTQNDRSFDDLGYSVGQDIGRFILSEIEQ